MAKEQQRALGRLTRLPALEDFYLARGSAIVLDPWSGEALSASLETDLSVREKVLAWNEAIHTGTALGMTSRIIVAAASILLPVQAVSGLLIWLRRRKLIELSESE